MDMSDFEMRVAELFRILLDPDADPDAGPPPELAALEAELAAAMQESRSPEAFEEIARSLGILRELLSNPELSQLAADATRDHVPYPPIFDAIDDGDPEAVNAALADWDIDRRHGAYESTALYHAMSCSHGASLEVITLLLDAGADPRMGLTRTGVLHGLGFGNYRGVAPKDLAVAVRRCVAAGADIEERSDHLQWTPLITAASEWNPVATEALLLAGADIDARAGNVEGVCHAGQGVMAFANGHEETTAVLRRYARPQ